MLTIKQVFEKHIIKHLKYTIFLLVTACSNPQAVQTSEANITEQTKDQIETNSFAAGEPVEVISDLVNSKIVIPKDAFSPGLNLSLSLSKIEQPQSQDLEVFNIASVMPTGTAIGFIAFQLNDSSDDVTINPVLFNYFSISITADGQSNTGVDLLKPYQICNSAPQVLEGYSVAVGAQNFLTSEISLLYSELRIDSDQVCYDTRITSGAFYLFSFLLPAQKDDEIQNIDEQPPQITAEENPSQPEEQTENISPVVKESKIIDSTPPANGSIIINAGSQTTGSTNLQVALFADDNPSQIAFGFRDDCSDLGDWQAYKTSFDLSFIPKTTDAEETIIIGVVFRDEAGNESPCYADSIIFDNRPPANPSIAINAGAEYTKNDQLDIAISAVDAAKVFLSFSAEPPSGADSWLDYASPLTMDIPEAAKNSEITVYASFADIFGNVSTVNSSIIHDDVPPDGVAVALVNTVADGGNPNHFYITDSEANFVSLNPVDSTEYLISTNSDCSTGSWSAYTSSPVGFSLTENLSQVIYAKFRDQALNESNCVSTSPSTVMLDQTPPAASGFSYSGAYNTLLGPRLIWDEMTESGSGIKNYDIRIGTSSEGSEVIDWTDTSASSSPYLVTDISPMSGMVDRHISLRATDHAGLTSEAVNLAGFGYDSGKKVVASDRADGDWFGNKVFIHGNYAAVAAPRHDSGGLNHAGAVYIYKTNDQGETWNQVQKITASDKEADDKFGYHSVSLSENYLIIGAYDEDTGGSASGKAYIYKKDDGVDNWTEVEIIQGSDTAAGANFGMAVAITDDYAVVGARYQNSKGKAYIFKRNQSTNEWNEDQMIESSDLQTNDHFGESVDIEGDFVIVNARQEDTNASKAGSAYIFKRNSSTGNWEEKQIIRNPNSTQDDQFSYNAVSISGDYAVVGNWLENTDGDTDAGAAYVFKRNSSDETWSMVQKLKASDKVASDKFGISAAISGDYIVVGAHSHEVNSNAAAGAVYVFKRDDGEDTWTQVQKVTSPNPEALGYFGYSVSISGDRFIVGSYQADEGANNAGVAYLFNLH